MHNGFITKCTFQSQEFCFAKKTTFAKSIGNIENEIFFKQKFPSIVKCSFRLVSF